MKVNETMTLEQHQQLHMHHSSSQLTSERRKHTCSTKRRKVGSCSNHIIHAVLLFGSVLLLLLSSPPSTSSQSLLLPVSASSTAELIANDRVILGVGSLTAEPLLRRAILAYSLIEPNISITFEYGKSSVIIPKLLNGLVDMHITATAPLTAANFLQYPDMLQLPLFVQQTAIGIHSSVYQGQDLVLSLIVLSRIISANITWWNDTQIQALNPTHPLPAQPIQIIMGNVYALPAQECICSMFNRIDPIDFPKRFPCTTTSFKPPVASYGVAPILLGNLPDLPLRGATTPYSLTISSIYDAKNVGLNIATIVNTAGKKTQPSLQSSQLAMLEVGFPLVNSLADLSTANGPMIYPFTKYIYLQFSKTFLRSTCQQKREILNFIFWMYTSSVMRTIAQGQFSPIVNDDIQDVLGIVNTLETDVTCLPGIPLYIPSTSSVVVGKIFGVAYFSGIMTNLFALYHKVYGSSSSSSSTTSDTTVSTTDSSSAAVTSLTNTIQYDYNIGKELQSFALMDSTVDPQTGQKLIDAGGTTIEAAFPISTTPDTDNGILHHSLPFATSSTTILYSPPAGLTFNDTGPIVLDLETVAMIYTGQVNNWLHPRIARLNEKLSKALLANTSINSNITVVICCTIRRGILPILNRLQASLAYTDTWSSHPVHVSHPTDWTLVFDPANPTNTSSGVAWTMADLEAHTPLVVKSIPGSIGYAAMDYFSSDDTVHVRLLPWAGSDNTSMIPVLNRIDNEGYYADALNVSIRPEPASSQACASFTNVQSDGTILALDGSSSLAGETDMDANGGALDILDGYFDFHRTTIPKNCYVITSAVQMLVPTAYSDATADEYSGARTCLHGKNTLELMKWLTTSATISTSFTQAGYAHLADDPSIMRYVVHKLEQIRCDGKGILVMFPTIWELDSSIARVGSAVAGLIMVLVIVSMTIAIVQRKNVIFASSSILLLGTSSLGLIFMCIAVILWSLPTTSLTISTCSTFIFFLQYGFDLTFVTIIMKAWRLNVQYEKRMREVNVAQILAQQGGNRRTSVQDTANTTHNKHTDKHTDKQGKSKPRKISNWRLLLMTGAFLLIDVIYQAIITNTVNVPSDAQDEGGRNIFTVVTTIVEKNGEETHYTHCQPQIGMTVSFTAWIVWKILCVLYGTMLMSTLKDINTLYQEKHHHGGGHGYLGTTGNHNHQNHSHSHHYSHSYYSYLEAKLLVYSFYNLLFSCLIILPLLALLSIVGDALVLIVSLLMLWIILTTFSVLWLPKLWNELRAKVWKITHQPMEHGGGTAHKQSVISTGGGESIFSGESTKGTMAGGGGSAFSFPLLSSFTSSHTLGRYMLSLDHHLIEAKKRLASLGGLGMLDEYRHKGGGGGGGGDNEDTMTEVSRTGRSSYTHTQNYRGDKESHLHNENNNHNRNNSLVLTNNGSNNGGGTSSTIPAPARGSINSYQQQRPPSLTQHTALSRAAMGLAVVNGGNNNNGNNNSATNNTPGAASTHHHRKNSRSSLEKNSPGAFDVGGNNNLLHQVLANNFMSNHTGVPAPGSSPPTSYSQRIHVTPASHTNNGGGHGTGISSHATTSTVSDKLPQMSPPAGVRKVSVSTSNIVAPASPGTGPIITTHGDGNSAPPTPTLQPSTPGIVSIRVPSLVQSSAQQQAAAAEKRRKMSTKVAPSSTAPTNPIVSPPLNSASTPHTDISDLPASNTVDTFNTTHFEHLANTADHLINAASSS